MYGILNDYKIISKISRNFKVNQNIHGIFKRFLKDRGGSREVYFLEGGGSIDYISSSTCETESHH